MDARFQLPLPELQTSNDLELSTRCAWREAECSDESLTERATALVTCRKGGIVDALATCDVHDAFHERTEAPPLRGRQTRLIQEKSFCSAAAEARSLAHQIHRSAKLVAIQKQLYQSPRPRIDRHGECDRRRITALDFIQYDLGQIAISASACVETSLLTHAQNCFMQQTTDVRRTHVTAFAGKGGTEIQRAQLKP